MDLSGMQWTFPEWIRHWEQWGSAEWGRWAFDHDSEGERSLQEWITHMASYTPAQWRRWLADYMRLRGGRRSGGQ